MKFNRSFASSCILAFTFFSSQTLAQDAGGVQQQTYVPIQEQMAKMRSYKNSDLSPENRALLDDVMKQAEEISALNDKCATISINSIPDEQCQLYSREILPKYRAAFGKLNHAILSSKMDQLQQMSNRVKQFDLCIDALDETLTEDVLSRSDNASYMPVVNEDVGPNDKLLMTIHYDQHRDNRSQLRERIEENLELWNANCNSIIRLSGNVREINPVFLDRINQRYKDWPLVFVQKNENLSVYETEFWSKMIVFNDGSEGDTLDQLFHPVQRFLKDEKARREGTQNASSYNEDSLKLVAIARAPLITFNNRSVKYSPAILRSARLEDSALIRTVEPGAYSVRLMDIDPPINLKRNRALKFLNEGTLYAQSLQQDQLKLKESLQGVDVDNNVVLSEDDIQKVQNFEPRSFLPYIDITAGLGGGGAPAEVAANAHGASLDGTTFAFDAHAGLGVRLFSTFGVGLHGAVGYQYQMADRRCDDTTYTPGEVGCYTDTELDSTVTMQQGMQAIVAAELFYHKVSLTRNGMDDWFIGVRGSRNFLTDYAVTRAGLFADCGDTYFFGAELGASYTESISWGVYFNLYIGFNLAPGNGVTRED